MTATLLAPVPPAQCAGPASLADVIDEAWSAVLAGSPAPWAFFFLLVSTPRAMSGDCFPIDESTAIPSKWKPDSPSS